MLFKRSLTWGGPAPLDPYHVFEIINAYTLAFFDRYIRNQPAPLLDQAGSQEVRYEAYRRPAKAPADLLTRPAGLQDRSLKYMPL